MSHSHIPPDAAAQENHGQMAPVVFSREHVGQQFAPIGRLGRGVLEVVSASSGEPTMTSSMWASRNTAATPFIGMRARVQWRPSVAIDMAAPYTANREAGWENCCRRRVGTSTAGTISPSSRGGSLWVDEEVGRGDLSADAASATGRACTWITGYEAGNAAG